MTRTLVTDLKQNIGNKAKIAGWIHNIRIMGKIAFIIVRDLSGNVQVVIESNDEIKKIKSIQIGSVLEIIGEIKATENTDEKVEIINPELNFINIVNNAWPVEINKPLLNVHLDTLLENRALTLRHEKSRAIFKIQAQMMKAYRDYLATNKFTEFVGPAMTASSSEGGAEIFKMKYFDGEATLAQSNQLYKQIMVGVYERVFGFAKWFRAENSNTRRHLTEGLQYEFEMGFIECIDDIFVHMEGVIVHMLKQVKLNCAKELEVLDNKLARFPENEKFPKYKFMDAIKIVAERTGEDTSNWDDLSTEAEKELCLYASEKYKSDFIIVTNYPKGKFYAYRNENGTYENFDVLCREAEIISGGRRIDNYQKLVDAIVSEDMQPSDFTEYLSIFKYGMPPHGGFGMGVERFTMLALGLDNIREASLFPSDTKRIASQTFKTKTIKGSESIKKAIKRIFVEADSEFSVTKHEATKTSEDSARVRGLELNTGIKALILKNKKTNENILVAIPANQRLDIKKLQVLISKEASIKLEMEKPEIIFEKFGLKVGGVPPYGHIFGIKTYIDNSIKTIPTVAFNNADLEESIITNLSEFEKTIVGEWVNVI